MIRNTIFIKKLRWLLALAIVLFALLSCDNTPTDQGPLWTKFWDIRYSSDSVIMWQIFFVSDDEAWITYGQNMLHYINGDFQVVNVPEPQYISTSIYNDWSHFYFRRVSFCDPNHGWAVGGDPGYSAIYKSENGNWQEIAPLDMDYYKYLYYTDVFVISPTDVWVAGLHNGGSSYLWHYDGISWSRFTIPTLRINRLYFRASNDGYLTTMDSPDHGGVVLHWDGLNWYLVFSSNTFTPWAIAFDNQNNGFLAVSDANGLWGLYHVGGSWDHVQSSYYQDGYYDMRSNSKGDIWAVGSTNAWDPDAGANIIAHWNGSDWQYERTIPATWFPSLFISEDGSVWSTVYSGKGSFVAKLNIN
jgi:hypothetical protein